MKKIISLALLMGIIFYACSEDFIEPVIDINENVTETNTKSTDLFRAFNLPFPNGTKFSMEGEIVNFQLPRSHYVVGVDKTGNFYESARGANGSVTCKCTEVSGCNPIKSGSDLGCLMTEGCKTCEKSGAISTIDMDFEYIAIFTDEYRMDVTNYDQLHEQYVLPPVFLNYDPIKNQIEELNKLVNADEHRSENTKIIFLNSHGYILPFEIPSNADNTSIYSRGLGTLGTTCGCNVQGNCPKNKKWGVIWCDASNCTDCTLSTSLANSNNEFRELEIKNDRVYIH